MNVPVREFKAKLSYFLACAQAGEAVEVTSHGKPIARIIGVPPQADAGLRRLMAAGLLSWNGRKPRFAPPQSLRPEGKTVAQMVVEDRD